VALKLKLSLCVDCGEGWWMSMLVPMVCLQLKLCWGL